MFGYAVGLDMTRRDLQNEMREKKRPWDIGKSFAQAAPIAPLHPVSQTGLLSRGAITLDVNGARRQQGDLSDMIWDVPHTLAFLSRYYELMPGDLVFSGTPAGRRGGGQGRSPRRAHRRTDAADHLDRMTDGIHGRDVERGYNNRAAVPDHPQHFATYAAWSRAAREKYAPKTNLRYGPNPRELLDLFVPAGPARGTYLYIHGGYWRALSKEDYSFVAGPFVEQGIAVAVMEYDLCPQVSIATIVDECRRAVLWLARDGAEARSGGPAGRRRELGGRPPRRDDVRDRLVHPWLPGLAVGRRGVALRRPRPPSARRLLVQQRLQARRGFGVASVAARVSPAVPARRS